MISNIKKIIKSAIFGTPANTGASGSKRSLRGWSVLKSSPDGETLPEQSALVGRARDLYRNNAIARGAIENQTTNVIGAGLKLQPRIDRVFLGLTDEQADEIESQIEREFLIWAESQFCDASKRSDFYELQELVLKSVLMSGEVFILLPMRTERGSIYDLRIQLIEGDRIESPNADPKSAGGIEVDDWGAPTAYWILTNYKNDPYNWTPPTYKRVLARGASGRSNVLHIYKQDRPGQRRGLPYLTPVIDILKNLTRYTESVLQRAIIQSYLTVFIESDKPDAIESPFGANDKKLSADEEDYNVELGPGAVMQLEPGEKISTVNPIGPDAKYDEFYMSNLKLIGMALEIPLEVLTVHFQSSYSAARAAFLSFHKTVKNRRDWLARKFCQPIYEEFLTESILRGRISAPGFFDDPLYRKAWARAKWNGPSPGQIDPIKEVEAYIKQRDEGFITNQDASAQINGSDWESNIRTLRSENLLKTEAQIGTPQK